MEDCASMFTWKHACFWAFMLKIYMEAQKYARFHVFSPFSASFYPPLLPGRAPKRVKLFINQVHTLDFDSAEQRKAVQEFE